MDLSLAIMDKVGAITSLVNTTDLPPLPSYELKPLPDLIPPIPDKLLTVLLPVAAYWSLSMFFHWIDVNDYFAQYRLHTPAELLSRNHVTRYEVVKDVIVQQIIQTIVGVLLGMTEPDDFYGKEEYDVAVWARRIRVAQMAVPALLALLGVDAGGLAKGIGAAHPALAGFISGGRYLGLDVASSSNGGAAGQLPGFAAWEILLAKFVYYVAIPVVQFVVGIIVVDTWQYFLHRLMHQNKWLYTTFHSRHHRLYVPYAFGALYNHPFEGFLLDTLGASVAFKLARMSTRQGMCFFTGSTFKTVDDHCGYALPWDPLQHLTSNNAGYHDIHHQSWGIKTNFSQPFFTFWDHILGTVFTGGDVSLKYERDRVTAQRKVDSEAKKASNASAAENTFDSSSSSTVASRAAATAADHRRFKAEQSAKQQQQTSEDAPVPAEEQQQQQQQSQQVSLQSSQQQQQQQQQQRRRRKASSVSGSALTAPTDSLRGLRDRVSIHGRTGGILGMEHSR